MKKHIELQQPTWPWEMGTLTGFISVFLLPFIVRLIATLLDLFIF
jgi:hypothetical protein